MQREKSKSTNMYSVAFDDRIAKLPSYTPSASKAKELRYKRSKQGSEEKKRNMAYI